MSGAAPTIEPGLAPEPVQPGIWRLKVPLHARAEPVNVWLLVDPDDGSVVVFDTGLAPCARDRFEHALNAIGAQPSDVCVVVVSHQHPDHVGGSRALHDLTGARVLATASTIEQTFEVWADDGRLEAYMHRVQAHIGRNGFPDALAAQLVGDHLLARVGIALAPEDAWVPVADGDVVEAAGRSWRVVTVPGHSDGQIVLHDERSGLLLSADHLLERISPAVGRFPGHEADPLARYLESLQRVADLEQVELVLPGHGAPFRGAAQRARALVVHHEERIDACIEVVRRARGPVTAFEVAQRVFPRVFADEAHVDPPSARFATTESIAHLEHARFAGRLGLDREDDELVTYRTL